MTHEQKPESAEFRTREAQADWMTKCITASGDHPSLPGFLREHLRQAEARGAAEQRRKEVEGCIPVHQFFMDGIWTDCSPKVYANQPFRRVLYTRPANVAALEAEIRILKMHHGAVRQVIHSPMRHFKEDKKND